MAQSIDWSYFEQQFGPLYVENKSRPGKPIRLLVARHYLKHTFDESDESVVERFLENPYWQYFAGYEHLLHRPPLDPTSLVKWLVGILRKPIVIGAIVDPAMPQRPQSISLASPEPTARVKVVGEQN